MPFEFSFSYICGCENMARTTNLIKRMTMTKRKVKLIGLKGL